jgi:ACS family D-galactonate transporter-like MFS transporter
LFWSLPAILGGRERAGFVGGTMNLSGQIAGIGVPVIIGVIVQASGGSYFGALMFMASAGVAMFVAAMMIDYSKKVAI